jgi:phage terminase small subunit
MDEETKDKNNKQTKPKKTTLVFKDEEDSPTPDEDFPKNVSPKVVKYYHGVRSGKTKTQAAIDSGYSPQSAASHTSRIEKSESYKNLDKYFQKVLLNYISMDELAEITSRNARQKENWAASNKAVEIALDQLNRQHTDMLENQLVVVLSAPSVKDVEVEGEEVK